MTDKLYRQLINQEIEDIFNNDYSRKLFIKKQIYKNYKIERTYHCGMVWFTPKLEKFHSCSRVEVLFSPHTYMEENEFKFNIKMPLDYTRSIDEKCGIEILKEIGNKKYDKNGKCVVKFFTNKELKEFCKMNKIKGYTKMSKLEILKALRTI